MGRCLVTPLLRALTPAPRREERPGAGTSDPSEVTHRGYRAAGKQNALQSMALDPAFCAENICVVRWKVPKSMGCSPVRPALCYIWPCFPRFRSRAPSLGLPDQRVASWASSGCGCPPCLSRIWGCSFLGPRQPTAIVNPPSPSRPCWPSCAARREPPLGAHLNLRQLLRRDLASSPGG